MDSGWQESCHRPYTPAIVEIRQEKQTGEDELRKREDVSGKDEEKNQTLEEEFKILLQLFLETTICAGKL